MRKKSNNSSRIIRRVVGQMLIAIGGLALLGMGTVAYSQAGLTVKHSFPAGAAVVSYQEDEEGYAEPGEARTVRMEVTAYCPCKKCCGARARGITASGKHIAHNDGRFVAADTSILPFGTKLTVPGYHDGQPVEVIDRGGAIKGHRLDVFFPTHAQALRWGRQWVDVTILD